MDEKTEELRDIFVDVTDESTVTERQEDTRGTLAREGSPEERVERVVETMRERYDFTTDLPNAALGRLVLGFYDGMGDAELTARVVDDADDADGGTDGADVSRHTVFRARMDLHLVRETDTDAPFSLGTLRDRLVHGESVADIAAELGAAESTVRRYRRVIETQTERRRVGDRFREEFDEILQDADLESLTDEVTRDGLDEATDGLESGVSF